MGLRTSRSSGVRSRIDCSSTFKVGERSTVGITPERTAVIFFAQSSPRKPQSTGSDAEWRGLYWRT